MTEFTPQQIERAKRDLKAAYELKFNRDKWMFYSPYISRECDSPYYKKGRKPQEEFHKSTAKIRTILAGNRSGKTHSAAMEAIWYSLGEHPYKKNHNIDYNPKCIPNHGWIIIPDWINHGINVTLPKMNELLPNYQYHWYGSERFWLNRRTGSTIAVKSAESGRSKFMGADIDWAWLDEEIPHDIYKETTIRLVDREGDMWLSYTPILGISWPFDELLEPWKNGKFRNNEVDFVNMGMAENPHIPWDAIDFTTRMNTENVLLPAILYGQYVQLAGLVYPTFDARETHLLDVKSWKVGTKKVFCAIDFGFTNPFVCLWFAVGGDGQLFVFDEYYKTETTISGHVDEIKRRNTLWGVQPSYYVADPEEAQSRHEMAQLGITTQMADKEFMEGMNRLREYLKVRGEHKGAKPMLFVHPRCEELIWEMGRYQFKERSKQSRDLNTYEMAEKKHDHGPDALRYAVMSRPSPAQMAKPRVKSGSLTDWEQKIVVPRSGRITP